jgi:peptide/nickel transport system substrate-binding protein
VLSGTDRQAAEEMFADAQKILVEECPAIFVSDVPDMMIVRSDIEGYAPNPAYPAVAFFHDLSTTR